ncbi:MAG: AAA family ATPase [Methylocystis sp.]
MRIERLHLERYGAFTERILDFHPEACLHVVLGANEAGKTSALCAIGDLLFGFEQRTKYDFQHEQKSLRVGARLRLADDALLSIKRRKGKKNTLFDEAEKPLADDLLAPLLGSLTRKTFFAEFGLTSRALREGGEELLDTGGRLAEMLAASSAQLSALTRLHAQLKEEANGLFGSQRVASKEFYAVFDRYREAEKRLREAIVTTEAFAAAERSVVEAEEKREKLGHENTELWRDLKRRERALRVWHKLDEAQRLREDLAHLADLPIVARETLTEWREALQLQASIKAELARQQLEEMEAAEEIAALKIDAPLIEKASEIEALRERLGAIREAESHLPRRREAARGAREQLEQMARRLGVDSAETMIAHQPTDAASIRAETAIEARSDAEKRALVALEAVLEAERRLQELERREDRQRPSVDPAPFRRRIEAFGDLATDADRARRERLAHDHAAAELLRDAERLDPCPGTPDALAGLPLPDRARIEAFRQLFESLEDATKRDASEARRLEGSLVEIEEELSLLRKAGAAATRDELAKARGERDESLARLRDGLDADPAARRDALAAIEASNRRIDAITDALLDDGERTARFANAAERREKLLQEREQRARALEDCAEQRRNASCQWQGLWAASGLEPRSPAEMLGWIEDAQEILEKRRRLGDAKIELGALTKRLEEARAGLVTLARDLGENFDPALPIDALFKHARAALDRLAEEWGAAQGGLARVEEAKAELARAKRQKEVAQTKLEQALGDWPKAMAPLALCEDASSLEAKAALKVWSEVGVPAEKLKSELHRVETMEADVAAFSAAVDLLVGAVAPDLRGLAQREALNALSARLALSQQASAHRSAAEEARHRREKKRVELLRQIEGAETVLIKAREALGVLEEAALGAALDRLGVRSEREQALSKTERDLFVNGEGVSEETLRLEQAAFDIDSLPGEIQRIEIGVKQMVDEIALAETRLHEARRFRDTLSQGRDAAGAAAEKAEAAAEIIDVSRRWLRRAAAAKLASLAIERHREATADPLIARASTLFAAATDGAFQTLGVDYDEADAPTLVGLRESGQRIPVTGMSEGTRDQLFLALRLALLELRKGEPLPFIGDDLLASFDDDRTRRALELLAQFGRERQAILFTHHRHVAEIASRMTDAKIDVVNL